MFQHKNRMTLLLFLNFLLTLLSPACRPEILEPEPSGAYSNGVFISNEGVFNQTSGTVSYFDGQQAEQAIFRNVNGFDLGNVVQSIHRHQSRVYVVVNNSQKVEIVEAESFDHLGTIGDLAQPRYLQAINDSIAYISEWGNDGLTGALVRVNLRSQSIVRRISCTAGPERMLLHNNKLYTVHTGGYGDAQQLSVLDLATENLQYITLSDRPSSLQRDAQGRIWVACSGNIEYSSFPNIDSTASTPGALFCLDGQNHNILQRFDFPLGKPPQQLHINAARDRLYYYWNAGVYELPSSSTQLPSTPLFSGDFYSMGCVEDALYVASNSGIDPSTAYRYNLEGQLIDSFMVGVFPSGFF